jgi:hypothetical protein
VAAIQRVRYKDIEQVPRIQIKKDFKKDFQGSSPSLFIGQYGYPDVNVGFLSPQFGGDTTHYDSPKLWAKGKFQIGTIASMRYGLVNSRAQWNIHDVRKQNHFLEMCKDIGMSAKSVEMEVNLKKEPHLNFKPETEITPFGPQSEVEKARVTSNPKVDSRVERVVSDTDLKAVYAVNDLYRKGFEETFLSKLLSSGNTGLADNRKLVPTRWSITAVDDTVGKQLIKEIKDLPPGEYQVFFGGGWGNYYLIFFFPEVWSYELFEMYLNYKVNPWSKEGNFYSTDYEGYEGRKEYAEECAGGYYACRIGVLEKMKEQKRQHSSLVLRFITPEYNIPLGVWVCREATRKSLNEKPISFASKELMFKYAEELVKRKLGFDINLLVRESKLLKNLSTQKKISEFIMN